MNNATIGDAVVRFSRLLTSAIGNASDGLGYASMVTGLLGYWVTGLLGYWVTGLRRLLPLFYPNRLTKSPGVKCV